MLAIRRLMERYGKHPALYGVELLNAPGDLFEVPDEGRMRPQLRAYYDEAYAVIRRHSPTAMVVFCVLYW